MKKYSKLLCISSIYLVAISAQASSSVQKDIHGFISIATNNNFKGLSYTNNGPSLNTSLFYTHPSGFTLGFVGGNTATVGSSMFLYPFLDFTRNVMDNIYAGGEIGHYFFPKYSDQENGLNPQYYNFKAKIGYKNEVGKIEPSISYSPNFYYKSGAGYSPELKVEYYLPEHFMLQGEVGYQYTKKNDKYRGKFDAESLKKGGWRTANFTYYKVGLFKNINSLILGLEYHGNTNSKRKCSEFASNICKNGVIASLTHAF